MTRFLLYKKNSKHVGIFVWNISEACHLNMMCIREQPKRQSWAEVQIILYLGYGYLALITWIYKTSHRGKAEPNIYTVLFLGHSYLDLMCTGEQPESRHSLIPEFRRLTSERHSQRLDWCSEERANPLIAQRSYRGKYEWKALHIKSTIPLIKQLITRVP